MTKKKKYWKRYLNFQYLKKAIVSNFQFPVNFFRAYPPLWLFLCLFLVCFDLGTKKLITNSLNYHLSYHQYKWLPNIKTQKEVPKALAMNASATGKEQINVWGENGKIMKLRLVFNDRFVFGLGPSRPYLGFFLSFFATFFLLLYRWKNIGLGYSWAWLFVFSGALGNLIDKLFIKSMNTREWVFSLSPQKGYISGVVDFFECIWFGWHSLEDTFLLKFLAMDTWPTFNVADSLIVLGLFGLLFSFSRVEKK